MWYCRVYNYGVGGSAPPGERVFKLYKMAMVSKAMHFRPFKVNFGTQLRKVFSSVVILHHLQLKV